MRFGCIGERLEHSFSAAIHPLLSGELYELCPLGQEQLEKFLLARAFTGVNVTIPYKEKVIPYLGWISPRAERIGAVNTILNRNGVLHGYNTDFDGLNALIDSIGLSLFGKKVTILGSGGTSRTAMAVAESAGASRILRVSRTAGHGLISYEELYRCYDDTEILINATPCGMYPHPERMAANPERFPHLCGVVDAVYNPLRTQFVLSAKRLGIPSAGGLLMLCAQAVRAAELFHDVRYPDGTAQEICKKLTGEKENIVLIGMPGSGKSTVGSILAKKMNRPFFDLDELICRETGKSISAVFAEGGETAFREIESRILRDRLSQLTGAVIATGGGTVQKPENTDAFCRNGKLFFLNRSPDEIQPTADRPLSSDREALMRRYRERYPIYCEVADKIIPVTGTAAEVADRIGKEWNT